MLALYVAKGKAASKTIDLNGQKLKDYDAGYQFMARPLSFENADQFHKIIGNILKRKSIFIVLGDLTEHGRMQVEEKQPIKRLKRDRKGNPATMKDCEGRELVLDIDGAKIPEFDPFDPEHGIIWLMDRIDLGEVTVTWQITASQKFDFTPLARIRLYFLSDKPYSMLDRRRWAKSLPKELCVDPSIFSGNQPIYTAPPEVESGADPIPLRSGTIWGEKEFAEIILPDKKPKIQNGGTSNANWGPLPRGVSPLLLIGDQPGGRGLHAGIRDAIWWLVMREDYSDEQIMQAVRARATKHGVLSKPRDSSYVQDALSDDELQRSIDGARDVAVQNGRGLTEVAPVFPREGISIIEARAIARHAANDVVQTGSRRAIIAPPGFGKTELILELLRGVAA